jgi:hypothetical protein
MVMMMTTTTTMVLMLLDLKGGAYERNVGIYGWHNALDELSNMDCIWGWSYTW